MLLESTRHQSPPVTFREALVRGLAPDGGLYLPTRLPRIDPAQLDSWRGLPLAAVATRLAERLLDDEFPREVIRELVGDAFSFPAPTVTVEDGFAILELFHGPTLAFKDFGARFLARFFGYLLLERHDRATILVATSGDTGSAVASGFHGVPNVRVVLLYPRGRVSPFQEAQMATVGGNVRALKVPGTFDDCQRLVKTAFLDETLAGLRLSSANSINIGRLLPQSFYYIASYLSVTRAADDGVVFSVPSGNLGNLTAGVIAQRMGLPVRRFIAASNVNDVLPSFLANGEYRARSAVRTLSNAMDVGDPSNFPRLFELHGGSLTAMRENLAGIAIDDQRTRETIRDVYARTGYLLDPHGAVGYAAAREFARTRRAGAPVVTLATAHPAKFGDALAEELGFSPPLPAGHQDWAERPNVALELPDAKYVSFRAFLVSGV
ncbi:MAG: threonine synthase [Acidobacteria bacterium]|nr:threonine synthase [Acidobacteriota bacterium]